VKIESQGTTSGESDRDNVVHLPARDWLGPREDLVPVGPAKHADTPPAPDDFWGEDSASLQDALRAPAIEADSPAPDDPTRVSPRRRPVHAPLPWRRFLAVGAVIAVAGVVALVLSGLGGGHAPARAVTTKTQLAAITRSTHKPSAAPAPRASHRRRRAAVHRPARRTTAHRHAAATTGTSRTAVTTPAASRSDSGASSRSTDAVSAPTTDNTTSDTHSSTGHPTGPGAPFSPGYIP
jgi:hypothetical protein